MKRAKELDLVSRGTDAIKSGAVRPGWKYLSEYLDVPNSTLRGVFGKHGYLTSKSLTEINKSSAQNSFIEYKEDGSVTLSRLLAIHNEEDKTPDRIIELCGFAPSEWSVRSIRLNDWNGMRKDDLGQIINHQVRVDLEPKNKEGISLQDIRTFFNKYENKKQAVKKAKKKPGRILEICLADLHIGNSTINVKGRATEVVQRILEEATNIESIILAPLGDTLHYDTMSRKTTEGTQLHYSMTPYEMYDSGGDVLISVIDMLLNVAPVDVIGTYGNHDKLMSYALFKGLEWYYQNNRNVSIDTEHTQVKFRMLFDSLILFAHGDMPKKNLQNLPYVMFKKQFGASNQAEIHAGHIHHRVTEEAGGVVTRFMPTVTREDEWHVGKGYIGSLKASMGYVWSERGLVNIIQANL